MNLDPTTLDPVCDIAAGPLRRSQKVTAMLAVTFSSDSRALERRKITLALLGWGHRVPEVAVAQRHVLGIRQGRQARDVLHQPGGRLGVGRVARPRTVA